MSGGSSDVRFESLNRDVWMFMGMEPLLHACRPVGV